MSTTNSTTAASPTGNTSSAPTGPVTVAPLPDNRFGYGWDELAPDTVEISTDSTGVLHARNCPANRARSHYRIATTMWLTNAAVCCNTVDCMWALGQGPVEALRLATFVDDFTRHLTAHNAGAWPPEPDPADTPPDTTPDSTVDDAAAASDVALVTIDELFAELPANDDARAERLYHELARFDTALLWLDDYPSANELYDLLIGPARHATATFAATFGRSRAWLQAAAQTPTLGTHHALIAATFQQTHPQLAAETTPHHAGLFSDDVRHALDQTAEHVEQTLRSLTRRTQAAANVPEPVRQLIVDLIGTHLVGDPDSEPTDTHLIGFPNRRPYLTSAMLCLGMIRLGDTSDDDQLQLTCAPAYQWLYSAAGICGTAPDALRDLTDDQQRALLDVASRTITQDNGWSSNLDDVLHVAAGTLDLPWPEPAPAPDGTEEHAGTTPQPTVSLLF